MNQTRNKSPVFYALIMLAAAAPLSIAHADGGDRVQRKTKVSRYELRIPVAPLAEALSQFGVQTGYQITYTPEVVEGVQGSAVSGRLSAESALDALLRNTGLEWSRVSGNMIVVRRKETSPIAMVLAEDAKRRDAADAASSGVDAEKSQVTVRDRRMQPFTDGNADIPRTINDAQPYYIFDGSEIERSGATNIEAFLKQRLTMNTVSLTNSQVSSGAVANYAGNTSTVNLRGLGADKTLILIDGRQRASVAQVGSTLGSVQSSNGGQPDLNGIPLNAIDRIEVLPTSASGIYGGNAIGGVVNVILKKDYQGGRVALSYDSPEGTGGNGSQRRISASYGQTLEDGRIRLSAVASWSEGKPLLAADRADILDKYMDRLLSNSPTYFSYRPWLGSLPNIMSSFGDPLVLKGGISLGSTITHLGPGIAPGAAPDQVAASLLANAGTYDLHAPPTGQYPNGLARAFGETPRVKSVSLSLSRQMTSRLDLFADFSIGDNKSTSREAPTASYMLPAGMVPDPADPDGPLIEGSAVNPFEGPVTVVVPAAAMLPTASQSRTVSALLGIRAQLPGGWMLQSDYSRSENRLSYTHNAFDFLGEFDALQRGDLNPFVDTLMYPMDHAAYFGRASYSGTNRLQSFTARASGSLPPLPWGAPQLTVGAGYDLSERLGGTGQNSYLLTTSNNIRTTYLPMRSANLNGYMESTIPLVKAARFPGIYGLDVQLSGRMDRFDVDTGTQYIEEYYAQTPPWINYGGGGARLPNDRVYRSSASYGSNNYTVGLKYQPVKSLTLRASRASAFLPPTPDQLLKSVQLDYDYGQTVNDPVTGMNGVPIRTIGGGNPDLKAQNSRSFNAGLIWQPDAGLFHGLRLNLEYSRLEQFDAIGSLNEQQIVDQEALYPGRVTRGADGQITLVDISSLNLYLRDTRQWDLMIDYTFDSAFGQFTVRSAASRIDHLRSQYTQDAPAYDAVGFPSEGGAARGKGNLSLEWRNDRWAAGWTARHTTSYRVFGTEGGPAWTQRGMIVSASQYLIPQGSDTIPGQTYHDLFLSYDFDARHPWKMLQGTKVQFGLRNVFDRAPPFDIYSASNLFISPYEDIRLRSYWLNASREF